MINRYGHVYYEVDGQKTFIILAKDKKLALMMEEHREFYEPRNMLTFWRYEQYEVLKTNKSLLEKGIDDLKFEPAELPREMEDE